MNARDFLKIYSHDSFVQNVGDALGRTHHVRIQGLTGSLKSISTAALYENLKKFILVILEDREEALYFYNDLQNLYGYEAEEIAYFPASFKHESGEIENANIIQRSALLTRFSSTQPLLIVTYPEALVEKVVSKKSLVANTLKVKVGDTLDLNFVTELLDSYQFEKTDFVYEPGQFAVRGGILDVFSYSAEVPYRIELFGDEVESIRAFEAESQLSTQKTDQISITPNLQDKLQVEETVSFFNFLPSDALMAINDLSFILDRSDAYYQKVERRYEETGSGDINLNLPPHVTHMNSEEIKKEVAKHTTIEWGKSGYFTKAEVFEFESKPQPSFHKDFQLLNQNLTEKQVEGYSIFIASDSLKQLNRLETLFAEVNPQFKFTPLSANLREGFIDVQNKLLVYTEHQIFERFNRYKEKEKFNKSKALTLKELKTLQPGDFVTHVDYGIGRFAGMETIDVGGKKQEAIRLVYRDNDLLYVNIHSLHKISKYSGKEGEPPTMSKLGSGEWEVRKSKVKKQVKDIAKELIALYAKRREAPGFAFSPDNYLQIELESSFMYEDTPDQAAATAKVKADMEKPYPMDRLVCGDVGFGKTEVAIRAAFKAAVDGKQVAVLVPTTILALQHFRTFSERLSNMPVTVDYLNRFKTTKDTNKTLKDVKEGKVDILIGTQKLLSKSLQFKDLGLLIIDEEQKFGVKAKDRIKELKLNVDVLTLTATPIPRTLHFSLMGARDLSVIATPPPTRQTVETRVETFKEEIIRDAITYELNRGGQVFFVHNRVGDIDRIANIIYRLVPEAKIGVAHGQMEGEKLEKVMIRFIENETNILISTNIIESGLDIPNANTIIINQAHMFGLSDLHQMRGRVGRSNKKAFCYLLTPPLSSLTTDARKRMQTIEQFSDLGDGFKVAMRDLDIRGAGNLLGAEQSGFINDLGYEMYHKILDEAVSELKETEFRSLFEEELSEKNFKIEDCQIETDMQILIPDAYISNIAERLSVYNTIDTLKTEDELNKLKSSLIDRFGPLPDEVEELFKIVRIRWKAEFIGFEKLVLKNNKLKGYFVSEKHQSYYQNDKFGKILDFIKLNPKLAALKQVKDKLVFEVNDVKAIQQIDDLFDKIRIHIES
ncbi:transcription-repair coupling factor [Leadbetterella byssophila DSM 17132]|uniref:Transcription-repair-coupling factor n=1 Tax=Leadbetterella byssophila (strain DSM 17132 / JCM 16389 / KACC 11308 / NBRC 106382 / 4M15) TaxID=649349 RepID=E4RZM3_LEAB4|nr:transcription-repair coupling factor [Leadbetterella byssophila]ADQ18266.1 transcription-repair coupling factor [Leadbetterella byssophila DSM 17132]